MIVNIEKAEEIVNYATQKKHVGLQKKMLHQMIEAVQTQRISIQQYLLTVDIISQQYMRKKQSLQHLIHQLENREQSLDQGLNKISAQQKELERRQARIEQDLNNMRLEAEQYREKKAKWEQQYSLVAALPLLSAQCKRKYIKARDRYAEAEQQVSEIRQALEKCRQHLKLVSKTVTAQSSEQNQVNNQRRGSVDIIESTTQQLSYLKQGCVFWSGFDIYQAQVVLESAIYLLEQPTKDPLVVEVWQKTFQLACFEYGDRELYGLARWNPETLQIDFECDLCQTNQRGWPKVTPHKELACELCATTVIEPAVINSTLIQYKSLPSIPLDGRVKKAIRTLFHHSTTRIGPVM